MAVSGLLALLDDIATIADDVASMASMAAQKGAATAGDVGTLAAAATKKTSGVVTDDMAVTAEQAIGLRREREIPVVVAVAKGSFKNKALFLAPAALLLNAVAPWSITPILMAGGTFLAFEGVEKVVHRFAAHHEDHQEVEILDPEVFEKQRVSGAIRTDFILSGEIIAITLGEVAASPFLTQVGVLYAISVVMTVGVYGIVAGLIKLDDFGLAMMTRGGPGVAFGRFILAAAPKLMHAISAIGTAAMMMVGGHILIEGIHPLYEVIHHFVEHLPWGVSGLVGALLDIAVGAVAGSIVVSGLALIRRLRNLGAKS